MSGDVVWWVLKKPDTEVWLVKIIHSMYKNAQICFRVNGTFSDVFQIQPKITPGNSVKYFVIHNSAGGTI